MGLAVLLVLLLNQIGLLDFNSPGGFFANLVEMVPFLVAIILAVTVHEFSHALVATAWGDDLPKREGRLTLNPLAHLDPLGSLLFLVAQFGWGKPVPINPAAMRNPELGWAMSSIAGPISNFISAIFGAAALTVLRGSVDTSILAFILMFIIINVSLGVFNLVPLPPLDGFGFVFGLAPRPVKIALLPIHRYGPWILLALIFLPRFVPGFPPIISTVVGGGVRFALSVLGVNPRGF